MHNLNAGFQWKHWIGYLCWSGGFFLIHKQSQKILPYRDPFLIPLISFLTGWGILAIFRLEINYGIRQSLWLLAGFLLILVMMRYQKILEVLRRYKYLWLMSGMLLTALTLIFGTYPGGDGPRLWLYVAGFYIQPSEPLKLLLIIFLAAYLADNLPIKHNFLQLIVPTLILFGLALTILLIQQDMGTSTLFIIIYTALIYLATGKKRLVLVSALAILTAGIFGYRLFDVIRLRVDAWINPWLDPSGRSFQIVQSLIAVAAGGVFGRGPGLGSPRLIPVAHSDFIFSAISEEVGLTGSIGLLLLMALLLFCGMRIAFSASNQFHRYLAAGLSTYILAQGILIIAGNLRLLPLTGVTLPFISYGGSSLLTNMIAFALLLIISGDPVDKSAPLPNPQPYLFVTAIALVGLTVIALSLGWWTMVRGAALQLRTDNLRRAINERYSQRGSILDQQSQPIVSSEGFPGEIIRKYYYPPLSATTGYNSATYGQSGIEQSMDGYLRGEKGKPAFEVWWSHLLYGQSPEGLDVRLSIDLPMQQATDTLISGKKGSAVLINALSGEILVLASHPNIDPNQVENMWAGWMMDVDAPLINRATQVNYALGTAIIPFLLTSASQQDFTTPTPAWTGLYYEDQSWFCAVNPQDSQNWNSLLKSGCPQALIQLTGSISNTGFKQILDDFGFTSAPQISLPLAQPYALISSEESTKIIFGNNPVMVSPLQVALAAAALSNGGRMVQPQLAIAVDSSVGWIILPSQESRQIQYQNFNEIAGRLSSNEEPIWEVNGVSYSNQGRVSWFIGGTTSNWEGTPYALVVVLEGNYSKEAMDIGHSIFESIFQP